MADNKRKRPQYTNEVSESVVRDWGSDLVKWIWGIHNDADASTKVRAEAYIREAQKIF